MTGPASIIPEKKAKTLAFPPVSKADMEAAGWDQCDIILVTGDAYIDHPSFGVAVIYRFLEAHGYRVGVIAQPDWKSAADFRKLGRPRLYFAVSSGAMDSMVNRYTADRKIRSDDAYTPGGRGGSRPDRAVLVYAQRVREAYPGVTVLIGAIEASLRRIAHYDYWSDTVRRSCLIDSKADFLVYGNAERAMLELTKRLDAGEPHENLRLIRGTAVATPGGWKPEGAVEMPYSAPAVTAKRGSASPESVQLRLPSFETVKDDRLSYARASRTLYLESNPYNARTLVQAHADRDVRINPPPWPLSTEELDFVAELPYSRAPHPCYNGERIPAWEMIRFSVSVMRGCFGGCSFCSITAHEGRFIQSRSPESVEREVKLVAKTPGFTGALSDLGGPCANMYRLGGKNETACRLCRRLSCLYPQICPNLSTDHGELISLYRRIRSMKEVKTAPIASGVRYDLALKDPRYIRELVAHHTGGLLKIAPEHTEPAVLDMMMKPDIGLYDDFKKLFDKYSKEAGKTQYLVPYFIAAHPGSTDEDMLNLALWLKRHRFKPDQVQTFMPTPLSLASTMYHTGFNPLESLEGKVSEVNVPKGLRTRRLQKAFLRFHDPENWQLLREWLRMHGKGHLIGTGPDALVPPNRAFGLPVRPKTAPGQKKPGGKPAGNSPKAGGTDKRKTSGKPVSADVRFTRSVKPAKTASDPKKGPRRSGR